MLAIDAATLEHLRQDQELTLGVTGLAYKRLRDQELEQSIQNLPESERIGFRARRAEATAAMLQKLPEGYAAEIAAMDALEDRASALDLRPAISVEKSWDALHHLFELAGGSIFEGEPLGPDQGYGPAVLRTMAQVEAFSEFLHGPASVQITIENMAWLRGQSIYAWPEPDDTSITDEELFEHLNRYFGTFKTYVAGAAQRGDALLMWIS